MFPWQTFHLGVSYHVIGPNYNHLHNSEDPDFPFPPFSKVFWLSWLISSGRTSSLCPRTVLISLRWVVLLSFPVHTRLEEEGRTWEARGEDLGDKRTTLDVTPLSWLSVSCSFGQLHQVSRARGHRLPFYLFPPHTLDFLVHLLANRVNRG